MKKIIAIVMASSFCLMSGISVAYYNTSSFGYDDTNIVSFDEEKISVLNYTFNYKKARENIKRFEKALPEKYITI